MAGKRQPTELVLMKGKKHFTKAEIEQRRNSEIKAKSDKVRPPAYLSADLKKKFRKLAKELLELDLISNLDCDALARLLIAQDKYIEVTKELSQTSLMVELPTYKTEVDEESGEEKQIECGKRRIVNEEHKELLIIQDRCWKQCRQGAADFGLTVANRCRIVVPKAQEAAPENKFAKYAK